MVRELTNLDQRRTRRGHNTKVPNRVVTLLTPSGLIVNHPSEISCKTVGQKAHGILTHPVLWTLPFFVVTAEAISAISDSGHLLTALVEAAAAAGLSAAGVIIRSNAVVETIADRGSLASEITEWQDAAPTLLRLQAKTQSQVEGQVHWIVQDVARSHAQGQLSNERRVSRENRDWALEVEKPQQLTQSIGVREWRSGKDLMVSRLICSSFLQISVALRQVAHRASKDSRRFLFEWVWDGENVWIVQLDLAISADGVNPKSLLPASVTLAEPTGLKVFGKHPMQISISSESSLMPGCTPLLATRCRRSTYLMQNAE